MQFDTSLLFQLPRCFGDVICREVIVAMTVTVLLFAKWILNIRLPSFVRFVQRSVSSSSDLFDWKNFSMKAWEKMDDFGKHEHIYELPKVTNFLVKFVFLWNNRRSLELNYSFSSFKETTDELPPSPSTTLPNPTKQWNVSTKLKNKWFKSVRKSKILHFENFKTLPLQLWS